MAPAVLFGDGSAVNGKLAQLLALEARCVRQWYPGPGTTLFFTNFAGGALRFPLSCAGVHTGPCRVHS